MLSIGDHNTLRQFSTLYICYRSSFESFSTLTNNYQDLSNGNKENYQYLKNFMYFYIWADFKNYFLKI